MPLDRTTVTVASRIMLPVYVVFFTLLGLTYLLTPIGRLVESPGLAYADGFLTLRGWGALFLAAAAVMAAALVRHERDWFRAALFFCAVCMAFFAAVLLWAGLHGEASFAAWSWPGIVVAACFASYRSLTTGERR